MPSVASPAQSQLTFGHLGSVSVTVQLSSYFEAPLRCHHLVSSSSLLCLVAWVLFLSPHSFLLGFSLTPTLLIVIILLSRPPSPPPSSSSFLLLPSLQTTGWPEVNLRPLVSRACSTKSSVTALIFYVCLCNPGWIPGMTSQVFRNRSLFQAGSKQCDGIFLFTNCNS